MSIEEGNERSQPPSANELKRRSMEGAAWHIIISEESLTIQDLLKRISDSADSASTKLPESLGLLASEVADVAARVRGAVEKHEMDKLNEEHKAGLRAEIGDLFIRVLALSYRTGIDPLLAAAAQLN